MSAQVKENNIGVKPVSKPVPVNAPTAPVKSLEQTIKEEAEKHKIVLQRVEKTFNNVQKQLTLLSVYSKPRYKLSNVEITRILAALGGVYEKCVSDLTYENGTAQSLFS